MFGFVKKGCLRRLALFCIVGKAMKSISRSGNRITRGATGFGLNGLLSALLLFVSAGCPPKTPEPRHGLEDNFQQKEARTLYDIEQFQIKVPVEYLWISESEAVPASSADTAPSAAAAPAGENAPWWSALESFPVTEVVSHSPDSDGKKRGKWVKTALHPSFLKQIAENKDLQPIGQFKVKARDEKSGTVREMIVQRVLEDWVKAAALTEENLADIGALRIKTSSGGEEVKNSISQVGAFY